MVYKTTLIFLWVKLLGNTGLNKKLVIQYNVKCKQVRAKWQDQPPPFGNGTYEEKIGKHL